MKELGQTSSLSLTAPGEFVVGCNYWASHAGTAMWSDWRADVAEADLKQLSEEGMQVLRVFPLWPDFQPLTQLYGYGGTPLEFRHGEKPLPYNEAGQAGVSEDAMGHFAAFADLTEKYGLKLIVGLVTGWMSGRLFVPPALESLNVLTDPVAIMWQVRFVRTFVRRFKDHPSILAWDLGNECNCMAPAPSREPAWVWTSSIVNAIRVEDGSRPIVSGMHSLSPDRKAVWTIQDQAELTDVLTTHPYPIFTPHCDRDPVNTIRSCLHAAAESRCYADIGGKPCLAEEVGTLGPMVCAERVAADYVRATLFSLWAHDCHGLLWWCAYDQGHLEHAPYDWHSHERELGLFRNDRTPKPVLEEIRRFGAFVKELPVEALPPRTTEAVCILTHDQDQWGAAYSSFVLATQAGFDLVFQYADQPLKEAAFYLMPSLVGSSSFSRRFWLELLERVHEGATLYLSHDDCMLAPFSEIFGLEVQTRERRVGAADIAMDGLPEKPAFTAKAPFKLTLQPTRAQVLGRETDGNPAFTRTTYGRGRLYFLSVPIETGLSNTPGSFHGEKAQPFWKIYRHIAEPFVAARAVTKDHPMVGVTEHPLADGKRVVVLINYGPEPAETALTLADGWSAAESWYGALPASDYRCSINANDAIVFTVVRE